MSQKETELKKAAKKEQTRVLALSIVIPILSSIFFVWFAIFWQDLTTLMAYTNAFYFSAFMFFMVGWMILMTNMNILAPFVYGIKTFFLMFAGKRPEQDYYAYTQDRLDNPIPKIYMRVTFYSALLNTVVAIILHMIL